MYKKDMGFRIKILRRDVCGYSQRRLAKLVGEDIETIRMIEDGRIKNPQPQLILRIAEILDSFYMEFVEKEYEDEFLYYLDWGTHDHDKIVIIKDLTITLSEILIAQKFGTKYKR
ncbi:MAG: helix-turn-helix transcriptional regulator [bacterium]|nr:helix-turn-helix transcriptional regulator [bacterium]